VGDFLVMVITSWAHHAHDFHVEFYDVPESVPKGESESIEKHFGESTQDPFINSGRIVSAARIIQVRNAARQFLVWFPPVLLR
jgi:hypothetical protein